MRVLVTGAQGCIGSWVAKQLLERGIDVLLFDLTAENTKLNWITTPDLAGRAALRTGSIEDTAAIKALVKDGAITHIIHLAAQLMPFCHKNPVAGGLINVHGTLNVFEAARDAGRPVRVIYASSSAVWGPGEAYAAGKLNEDNPLKPATHYGVFKQANEGNARAFYSSEGISSIGLRPWTVYGVGRDYGLTADPTLAIRALARREKFQIRLSGQMDMQYVRDVAEAFVQCALSPLEGAHVFNLEGDVVSMDEFIALLTELRPEAAELLTASGPRVPVAVEMDGSQLRANVPGLPSTPLSVGVKETLESFENLFEGERKMN